MELQTTLSFSNKRIAPAKHYQVDDRRNTLCFPAVPSEYLVADMSWEQRGVVTWVVRDDVYLGERVSPDDWYDLEWDEDVLLCEPGEVDEPKVLRAPLEYDLSPVERSLLLSAFSRINESASIPVSFDSDNEPDGQGRDAAN